MDKTSSLWASKKVITTSLITVALFLNFSICLAGDVIKTINIQYPSKQINDPQTILAVPGFKYEFEVEGDLPAGTHIEWEDQSTTRGSWADNVLTPYETWQAGTGSYSITAVLVGGEGEGPGWEATASGSIKNPQIEFSLPSDDEYFAKDQTGDHTVNIKATVKTTDADLKDVDIKFIAEKASEGQINIGSDKTNSSGDALFDWTVSVGATEIYTLKAGTGSDYENLENEVTCGEKVGVFEVKIEDPTPADNKIALTSSLPASIAGLGKIYPQEIESDLFPIKWKTTLGGTEYTKDENRQILDLPVNPLPSNNSAWGNNTLEAKVEKDTAISTNVVSVVYFFPRDATNNPGGSARNWFYYWKNDSVVSDLSQFGYQNQGSYGAYDPNTGNLYVRNDAPTSNSSYVVTKKHTSITSGANGIANTSKSGDDIQVIAVGSGKPNTTAITVGNDNTLNTTPAGDDAVVGTTITTGPNGVCNTTKSGDDVQVIPVGNGEPNSTIVTAGSNGILNTTPSGDDAGAGGGQQFTIGANGTGINCCAETCTHELKHKWIHDNWGGQADDDEDGVPDSQEGIAPYYFNPKDPDSYNLAGTIHSDYADCGDEEFLAWKAEQNPGSVDANKDWSDTNGKQW